jgi:hypothetical protein
MQNDGQHDENQHDDHRNTKNPHGIKYTFWLLKQQNYNKMQKLAI